MDRAPLGVPAAGHQPGVLQHLQVLGHRLDGDVVGLGQLVDGGVTLTGGVQLIRKKTVATGTICLRAALLLDLFMDVPSRNGSQEQGVVCP